MTLFAGIATSVSFAACGSTAPAQSRLAADRLAVEAPADRPTVGARGERAVHVPSNPGSPSFICTSDGRRRRSKALPPVARRRRPRRRRPRSCGRRCRPASGGSPRVPPCRRPRRVSAPQHAVVHCAALSASRRCGCLRPRPSSDAARFTSARTHRRSACRGAGASRRSHRRDACKLQRGSKRDRFAWPVRCGRFDTERERPPASGLRSPASFASRRAVPDWRWHRLALVLA